MRILTFVTAIVTLFLAATVFSFGRSSMHGLKVAHQAFDLNGSNVQPAIDRAIESLDSTTFKGHLSAADDRIALNEFISTIASQAQNEKWNTFAVEVWVGGKTTPAGYYVRYSATGPNGLPIEGGGLIATDKAAAKLLQGDFTGSTQE